MVNAPVEGKQKFKDDDHDDDPGGEREMGEIIDTSLTASHRSERVESATAALRFAMHRRRADFRTVVAVGVLGGLVALLAPILTGEILERIIPRAGSSATIARCSAYGAPSTGTRTRHALGERSSGQAPRVRFSVRAALSSGR